jgi:hypothetical protein
VRSGSSDARLAGGAPGGALQLAVRGLLLRILTFPGTLALARILVPSHFGVFAIVSFMVSVRALLGSASAWRSSTSRKSRRPCSWSPSLAWIADSALLHQGFSVARRALDE